MIQVLKSERAYRISRMGNSIVVNFHGRWSQLFRPLSWEYTHPSDLLILEAEALRLINGRYSELTLRQAREQVESVPESSLGISFL